MDKHWCSTVHIALILLISPICFSSGQDRNKLKLVAEWMEVEYNFPSDADRDAAIADGKYIGGNSLPIDVDVYYRDQGNSKVFVTIPRFIPGIPATLGTVTSAVGTGGPKLEPYPDYTWHSSHGTDCAGLTSVFRIAIDECKRLWVLDTGRIGDTQHCPPQIVAFHLETNKEVNRYKLPARQYKPGVSLFVTPIVDVRDPGTCKNTMIYLGDINGNALVVYDVQRGVSWKVQNKSMYPVPKFGTISISGESFDLMDGILGMAISSKANSVPNSYYGFFPNTYLGGRFGEVTQNDRLLYFHALASDTENTIPLRLLDNQTNWISEQASMARAFIEIGFRGVQSGAEAMDRNGNLFFGLIRPNAIACWDSSTEYAKQNMKLIAQSETKLQFASGVKVITNRRGKEELWVVTNRFQKFATGSMKTDEVNFRIQALPIEELLGGTKCTGSNANRPIAFPSY